jgi:hypothetical protein
MTIVGVVFVGGVKVAKKSDRYKIISTKLFCGAGGELAADGV